MATDFISNIIASVNHALYGYILIIVLIFGKYVVRAPDDYTPKQRLKEDPTFKASDINLPHPTDYRN